MASGRLEGKVAIVTGAGSGFGAAIAELFASQGAHVLVGDINVEGGQKVAQKNNNMQFLKIDVTSRADWDAAVKEAVSKWGKIDILVNNAGTSYRNKPTLEVTEAEYDRVFNVNVKSIFHSVLAVVPQMIMQNHTASIINVASIGAFRPRPGLVWYNSSKGAVANATKGLAAEYGAHQIRVNALCPLLSGTGLFSTFVGVEDTPENRKNFIGNVPLGRLTEPTDVAHSALYFASDDSKFITGTTLEVDGGRASSLGRSETVCSLHGDTSAHDIPPLSQISATPSNAVNRRFSRKFSHPIGTLFLHEITTKPTREPRAAQGGLSHGPQVLFVTFKARRIVADSGAYSAVKFEHDSQHRINESSIREYEERCRKARFAEGGRQDSRKQIQRPGAGGMR